MPNPFARIRPIRLGATASLRRFGRDRRGVTIVEFAFVAGPLMALLIAILQVSLTFFAQQNLETAAEKSTRVLMTGEAQQARMSAADFKALTCAQLPRFMKCANVMVDVTVATSFSAANIASPTITYNASGQPNNAWSYNAGVPGDIVIVKTMYVWDTARGPLGFDLSTLSGGKRLLIATSVFKTEFYS